MLNKLHFLIKICIGSFQEAIKKIQELPKINMSEPPSFQASMPLSLRVPAAKCLGGIREAQTIPTVETFLRKFLRHFYKFVEIYKNLFLDG